MSRASMSAVRASAAGSGITPSVAIGCSSGACSKLAQDVKVIANGDDAGTPIAP